MWLGLSLLALLMVVVTVETVAVYKRSAEDLKYFHEPGNGDLTGHYDIRYFAEVVDYDTRLDTLKHMVRAWLQTTNREGIETWIAHGTLLGWWWNGEILPWDWDLDVQVHGDTLKLLGDNYNMTTHSYTSSDGKISREYLLDINPYSAERVRGNGMNIIDARWVDMRNGLYIDITGISETDPKDKPGTLFCKNLHAYQYEDIWPLINTTFEGEPALIPQNYEAILIEEYHTKALVATEYEGHRWNPKTKAWDVAPDVPTADHGGQKNKLREPMKYETVDPGGIIYNLFRLVYWWD
ncbi:hypothetical protein EX30DRAFT_398320 [Ascodesmis nigricans]|uniref:LicD/FKTN/FKRP nucleotidyltransferase domain-containing protein n=1 Tax=Ascodesmis nigricans TaxID=341454 RepID=A0A4S2MLE2_9PEZI|nr:hypothetical protein EX30DRAFT_398320 [Ascodesmis nigricans]